MDGERENGNYTSGAGACEGRPKRSDFSGTMQVSIAAMTPGLLQMHEKSTLLIEKSATVVENVGRK